MVRKGGLEPPWVTPPDPKSGASANSATFASREAWCPLILNASLVARPNGANGQSNLHSGLAVPSMQLLRKDRFGCRKSFIQ